MTNRRTVRARSKLSDWTAGLILVTASITVVFATAPPAGATFPGANGKIAFALFEDPSPILSMDADGTNRTVLALRSTNISRPAWSADGTKIAYARQGVGLMTMSANGTGKTVVVADTRRHKNIGNPSWSPDGTKLVFDGSRFQDESEHIFVVNSDGTGLLRIDSPRGRDELRPDWSPDGLRIVFDSRARSFLPRITTMDPDGGNRVYLTQGDTPTWSPDGSQITFIGIGGSSFLYDVFVVNADGTGRTRLSDTPRRNEFWPAFSPDGTQIAYSRSGIRSTFGTDDIWIMNADGSSPTQITDTPRKDEFALSWQAV